LNFKSRRLLRSTSTLEFKFDHFGFLKIIVEVFLCILHMCDMQMQKIDNYPILRSYTLGVTSRAPPLRRYGSRGSSCPNLPWPLLLQRPILCRHGRPTRCGSSSRYLPPPFLLLGRRRCTLCHRWQPTGRGTCR
jgi:hypothetical protein